jgi:hypothetical protein
MDAFAQEFFLLMVGFFHRRFVWEALRYPWCTSLAKEERRSETVTERLEA